MVSSEGKSSRGLSDRVVGLSGKGPREVNSSSEVFGDAVQDARAIQNRLPRGKRPKRASILPMFQSRSHRFGGRGSQLACQSDFGRRPWRATGPLFSDL